MNITEDGLALIRTAEGFRDTAYRDSTGVWTIGYGHTSMAGAPEVTDGLTITPEQGEQMLAADVAQVADGLRRILTRQLTDTQFSALVSFAYNVGIGNAAKSSVLKAVNSGDFAAVPRRLQVWVNAGGKTLPGLVKRRAAEAELFMKAEPASEPRAPETRGPVTPAPGKPLHQSVTVWAALAAALLACANHVAMLVGYTMLGLVLTAAIVAAAIWIIQRRRRKSAEEGI
jgi:lysozyme